ncbi:MAG: hypothetical protein NTW99_02670 [Chloroflexi bacterium]|nr:hypothetical protein [Chloroflexota bacterium]
MKLNLALAQINTEPGNIQANLENHLTLAKQACQDGMDLVVFPELSLTGYVLEDLVPAVSCRPESDDPFFQQLLDASCNIDLVVGFVDPNGKLVAQAPYFEEALTKTEIDLNQLYRIRARLPLLGDERPELVQRELERILHGN